MPTAVQLPSALGQGKVPSSRRLFVGRMGCPDETLGKGKGGGQTAKNLRPKTWRNHDHQGQTNRRLTCRAERLPLGGRPANEVSVKIADYAATACAVHRQMREQSGKQPGDPVREASLI